ncbi:MAG: hypothetical protein IT435_01440 [Phycisphaerales bacterium]|nr:hypothetical protein [Phycisphaerales bacterium]
MSLLPSQHRGRRDRGRSTDALGSWCRRELAASAVCCAVSGYISFTRLGPPGMGSSDVVFLIGLSVFLVCAVCMLSQLATTSVAMHSDRTAPRLYRRCRFYRPPAQRVSSCNRGGEAGSVRP